jgi:zinc transport system permease protein
LLELNDITWMLSQGFFQRALVGGICAAVLCSVLGVFIVLRRQSLIGEGISHLAFGGIAAGLFFSIYPLYMALVFALFGTIAISMLQRKGIVYSETAIGILFSLGLALGAVLASLAGGFNVDLFGYLFGSILTVSESDLIFVLVLTALVLGFTLVFYKELLHMTFDSPGARLAGVPISQMDLIFNIVVALTVVISIKIVGSLLISALIIIPAASSMQLSRSFKGTMIGGVIFSIIAVIDGLLISFFYDVAAGGAIVLISVIIFALSVLLKRFFYKGAVRTEVEICDD